MRYGKGKKETSRSLILEVAGKRFCEDGIDASGIASIMSDAGLTHGAFYAHFESKEDLVKEVVEMALQRWRVALSEAAAAGPQGLRRAIEEHLRPKHCGELGVSAGLIAELVRHPRATRAMFADALLDCLVPVADCFAAHDESVRRSQAAALFAQLIGTLQLARMMPDDKRSDEILQAGIEAACHLLERATEPMCRA